MTRLRFLLGLGLVVPTIASAQPSPTVQDLIDQGRLDIRTWIEPDGDIVATQRVDLKIEIATDKWFTGGTRIGRLELDNAIVLPQQGLAVNSTRRVGAATWSVQTWTITLFPQRDGGYTIPALPLTLSVAGPDPTQPITGQTTTTPLRFQARVPAELAGVDGWVATTRLAVDETYDRDLEGLAPGDAVRRTVRIRAADVAGMMLPTVEAGSIDGVGIYQRPPQVGEDRNRGAVDGQRVEVLTYIIEKPGTYTLPERRFFWWNLATGAAEAVTLPARTLRTAGSAAEGSGPDAADAVRSTGRPLGWRTVLAWFGYGGGGLLAAWLLGRGIVWVRRRRVGRKGRPPTAVGLGMAFIRAAHQSPPTKAIATLYRWLDHNAALPYKGSVRAYLHAVDATDDLAGFDAAMDGIYGPKPGSARAVGRLGRRLMTLARSGRGSRQAGRQSLN